MINIINREYINIYISLNDSTVIKSNKNDLEYYSDSTDNRISYIELL